MGGDGRGVKTRPDNDRKLFSLDELRRIFGMHWYQHGRGRDTADGKPGKHYRPFYYWLPLLALHTGGRANEIGQLYLSDICVSDGGTAYIAFRLDQADKLDVDDPDDMSSGGLKSLKTVSSERAIALHPTLLSLGILEYVEALKSAGHKRLFPELRFDRKKGYGLEGRKWFNDRLLRTKLKIPRDGKKTLHSMRHHFAAAVEISGAPPRVQSQLLGHQRGQTLGQIRYTPDREADELFVYVSRLKFELPNICKFDIEAGLRAVKYALAVKRSNHRTAEVSGTRE